jgi:predicted transporter
MMIFLPIHFPENDIISPFCVAEENCIYMYATFFTHSSTSDHLSWFHSLAAMNNTTINIGIQVSLTLIICGIHTEVVWMDHMEALFLIF